MTDDKTAHYNAYTKMEVAGIEAELKDWFLSRRLEMERNMAIKKELDANNFTGRIKRGLKKGGLKKELDGDNFTRKVFLFTRDYTTVDWMEKKVS